MHFLYQQAESLPFPILYFLSSFPISDPSLKTTDERSMMMKMPWRRKSRSFHLQLQGAIGTSELEHGAVSLPPVHRVFSRMPEMKMD
uniref:Uncharacterized protein n=1 Tax=Manihot esculenta TaxID=3983 RepID=A0A199UC85_MANES